MEEAKHLGLILLSTTKFAFSLGIPDFDSLIKFVLIKIL